MDNEDASTYECLHYLSRFLLTISSSTQTVRMTTVGVYLFLLSNGISMPKKPKALERKRKFGFSFANRALPESVDDRVS